MPPLAFALTYRVGPAIAPSPGVRSLGAVTERDVEKNVSAARFVETLRRLADAIEAGEPFRIQVENKRFTVPKEAELVIEHEVEDGREELSLELQWGPDAS